MQHAQHLGQGPPTHRGPHGLKLGDRDPAAQGGGQGRIAESGDPDARVQHVAFDRDVVGEAEDHPQRHQLVPCGSGPAPRSVQMLASSVPTTITPTAETMYVKMLNTTPMGP